MPRLSVYIMAQNEAKRIHRTLESVKDIADELVVIDGGSSDETVAICREYTDKVIIHPFEGYALQRTFALTQVTGDWILAIDADETLSPELHDAIPSLLSADDVDAYDFSRRNYVRPGVWLQYGGWYPDYQRRLFRRGIATYGNVVHAGEVPAIAGKVAQIRLDILHDQINNNIVYNWRKLRHFARSEVKETTRTHMRVYHLVHAVKDFALGFFKGFIAREGYRMGVMGARASLMVALLRFMVHIGLVFKSEQRILP
jgi:glycosyltransferase involved in cell wall biosynthesis